MGSRGVLLQPSGWLASTTEESSGEKFLSQYFSDRSGKLPPSAYQPYVMPATVKLDHLTL